MPRKSEKVLGRKELNERERKERSDKNKIQEPLKAADNGGTHVAAAKQLITDWEGDLSGLDGIGIHNKIESHKIELFKELLRKARNNEKSLNNMKSLETVANGFLSRSSDAITQLEKREENEKESHKEEILFLQELQKTIMVEIQSLKERLGIVEEVISDDMPTEDTQKEHETKTDEEIMSDYTLQNLLKNVKVVGIKGGLSSISKDIDDKIKGDKKRATSPNTSEEVRDKLTGEMSLEKRIEFYNELISGPNPVFKSVLVMSGHEKSLDGTILFSLKDESDPSTKKEAMDLFVAETFYENGDSEDEAYGYATYILPRNKIATLLFGHNGKGGRRYLQMLAGNPREGIVRLTHHDSDGNVEKYHSSIKDPEKAVREKLAKVGIYTYGWYPTTEDIPGEYPMTADTVSRDEEIEFYNRIFMADLNEFVFNGALTEEEIEECLRYVDGRIIDKIEFDELYRKKTYRDTSVNNRDLIIKKLKSAGKVEDLTDKQIDIEAKKVYFYLISKKQLTKLSNKGIKKASEIIEDAVSNYQEYISELLAGREIEDIEEIVPEEEIAIEEVAEIAEEIALEEEKAAEEEIVPEEEEPEEEIVPEEEEVEEEIVPEEEEAEEEIVPEEEEAEEEIVPEEEPEEEIVPEEEPEEEITPRDPIEEIVTGIRSQIEARQAYDEGGKKLVALSEEYDRKLEEKKKEKLELLEEKSTVDPSYDAKIEEEQSSIDEEVQDIDAQIQALLQRKADTIEKGEKAKKAIEEERAKKHSTIDEKIEEASKAEEEMRRLKDTTDAGIEEAKRMVQEKNAEIAKILGLDTDDSDSR